MREKQRKYLKINGGREGGRERGQAIKREDREVLLVYCTLYMYIEVLKKKNPIGKIILVSSQVLIT
jgi:hypothetical protein